jgi:outer membrane protein assembly factor BamB
MVAMRQWVVILAVVMLVPGLAWGSNWPQWRGPTGDSVSTETHVPVQWDEKTNVLWKTPLPELGTSTPAIWGDALFITTQDDDKLLGMKLDRRSGEIVWTRQIGTEAAERKAVVGKDGHRKRQKFHKLHNMASPSPVTDGEVVIFHFGNGDLVAMDFSGKELWRRNLQKEHGIFTIWWGHANSPVLVGDLVITVSMQDSLADLQPEAVASYLLAHDKRSGELKWKTLRDTGAKAEACDAYTTPILRPVGDRVELVIAGGTQIDAYDPATGKQLWFLPNLGGNRTITGPTLAHGLVYATVGQRGPLLAVRPEGSGKLPADAIAWKQTGSTPDTPCPVVWRELIFTVSDNGVAQCLDAKSGAVKWNQRLSGDYKASPLAVDGRIYFVNTTGLCTVVAAAPTFEKLAANQVSDEILASPAVADGKLYLRGRKSLYCIDKR